MRFDVLCMNTKQHKKMSANRGDSHKVAQWSRQNSLQLMDDPFKCQTYGQSSLFNGNPDPMATIDRG